MTETADVLERLVGSWDFVMQHVAVTEPVTGWQRYERVLGGAFLLQHWTYRHPDFPDALALWTTDVCHSFDVRGIARVFAVQPAGAGWSMARYDADFFQPAAPPA